ncbi:MAG: hypothetical protein QM662_00990 [Gordonia sp. (in: high G+C Gram-positive bacteria)]
MRFPKFVGAAMVAAAVTVSLAACGGEDDADAVPTVPATSSAAASTGAAASSGAQGGGIGNVTNSRVLPTVAQLNAMLETALDPDVPNSQKVALVQHSERDPDIFDKLVQARRDNPDVRYSIRGPVRTDGPNRGKVRVNVKLPEQAPTDIDAQIVFDHGRWKLASSTVCPLITGNGVSSAMCPSASTSRTGSTSATR